MTFEDRLLLHADPGSGVVPIRPNLPVNPSMTLELNNPDLATDPAAQRAVKDETVSVEFAGRADALVSAVGLNRYLPGDALITGSTGDRW